MDFELRALRRNLSYFSYTFHVTHNAPVKKIVINAKCLFSLTRDIL
jgi:hypothetical protein